MPTTTHAAVQITEVMYDPPGANAGAQWLELTNMGDLPISLAQYKIADGGTNHKITVMSGTSTLAVGRSGIVASDPQTFLARFPDYTGALFKSAISFASKKGDTVTLKDARLQPIDTVSYDPSAGAAGDGNTLHRTAGVLVVGAPNPGSILQTEPLQSTETTTSKASSATTKVTTKATTKTAPNGSSLKTSGGTSSKKSPFQKSEAASPLLSQIGLPHGAVAWMLGAVGLVLLGIAAVWYLWLSTQKRGSNLFASETFTIEE